MSNLLCFIFGHKFKIHREISDDIRELVCERCGKYFGMHDGLKIVLPLDVSLQHMHDIMLMSNSKTIEVTDE